jgi:hypothetical protein
VDFIPYGYKIWNIGKNMIGGYLPLVQTGGYDGCQVIGVKKAIKIEGAQTILEAIGNGQNTIQEMEDYIKTYKNSKEEIKINQIKRFERALPIMHKIKWS